MEVHDTQAHINGTDTSRSYFISPLKHYILQKVSLKKQTTVAYNEIQIVTYT